MEMKMAMRITGGFFLALTLVCCAAEVVVSGGCFRRSGAASVSDLSRRPPLSSDRKEPPCHRRQRRQNEEVFVEHAAVAARHLVTVFLALDVHSLNAALLRRFRGGMAEALGVPVGLVHINALDKEKNCVEIFVSLEPPGASEPRPARDVVQSLNVSVLHRQLAHFGITQVSTEDILQAAPPEHPLEHQRFYSGVVFLAVFLTVSGGSTLLYRLETTSNGRRKAPPLRPPTKVVTATSEPLQQAAAAQPLAPPPVPPLSPVPASQVERAPPVVMAPNGLKPCSSPFRIKPPSGLQERRGSNVSLVLDTLAPVDAAPPSPPREEAAREYLMSAGRALTLQQLRDVVKDAHLLHAEFAEIPMNFTEPKQVDVPDHWSKNRYKSILPNPGSRVLLRSASGANPLGSYINANYIRGYGGAEKAFIATQGPMVNTVDDFWLMAWQEAAPAVVMITKLKEKKEKCVLYWPEKRGIYGRVQVEVAGVRDCRHYTVRRITLKCGRTSHTLHHFWFTSWPDHKTPDATLPLLQLMDDVQVATATSPGGPIIVHCSAGIGRTGCFVAACVGAQQLAAEGVVDVLAITCRLRLDRGGMIQTPEQYEFVHHALSLYEARRSDGARAPTL